jgi:Pectate lyase superfamily protein
MPQPPFNSPIQTQPTIKGVVSIVNVWQNWLQLAQIYLANLTGSGPTEGRPTNNLWVGQPYFDTTLVKQVIWDGSAWVSNGGGGTVTAVTGTAPISSTGGTTPDISITQANSTTSGYLSSTDWNTFNGKVSSVSGTAPVVSSGGTSPVISMAQASASANGWLSSADWSTFNGKLNSSLAITQNGGSPFSPAASSRLVSDMLGDYVSVKDFGAVGDGSADDTAAINKAISAISSIGGTVYFPAGTYKTTSTITIPNAVSFLGAGSNASTIKGSMAASDIIQIGDGSRNGPAGCTIDSIGFGSSVNNSASAIRVRNGHRITLRNFYIAVYGVTLGIGVKLDGDITATTGLNSNQYDYLLDGFEISNPAIGILIGSDYSALPSNKSLSVVQDTTINNGVVAGCSTAGMIAVNSSGLYMNAVDFTGCYQAIQTFPGTSQSVKGCFFNEVLGDTCTTYGWNIGNNGGNTTNLNIVNSWGSSNSLSGVVVNQSTGTTANIMIAASRFVNNGQTGIEIDSGSKITISDCHVLSNSMSAANTYDGIGINNGVTDWNIVGNYIGLDSEFGFNNQRYGIFVGTGCSSFSIVSNNAEGNSTAGGSINSLGNVKSNVGIADSCPYLSVSRSFNVNISNNNDRPMFVSVWGIASGTAGISMWLGGTGVGTGTSLTASSGPSGTAIFANGIVPPQTTYRIELSGSLTGSSNWVEMILP